MNTEATEVETEVRGTEAAVAPDEIDRILNEVEPEPEPGEADAERDGPSGAELVAPIVELVSAVAVPNWRLKAPEKRALTEAYGALIDKYFPDGPGQWGPEINAIMLTAAIVTPRLVAGTPPRAEEKAINREAASDGADD